MKPGFFNEVNMPPVHERNLELDRERKHRDKLWSEWTVAVNRKDMLRKQLNDCDRRIDELESEEQPCTNE